MSTVGSSDKLACATPGGHDAGTTQQHLVGQPTHVQVDGGQPRTGDRHGKHHQYQRPPSAPPAVRRRQPQQRHKPRESHRCGPGAAGPPRRHASGWPNWANPSAPQRFAIPSSHSTRCAAMPCGIAMSPRVPAPARSYPKASLSETFSPHFLTSQEVESLAAQLDKQAPDGPHRPVRGVYRPARGRTRGAPHPPLGRPARHRQ